MDLTELRDRVSALPTLENRLAHLQKEIRNAEDEVSGLLRQYERERRDVEQIQMESFSAFLYRLVGKYEDKLEKEQREEIDANTDLSVRGQIKDNAAEVRRLLGSINAAESALKAKLRAEEARLAENGRREEELLLTLR